MSLPEHTGVPDSAAALAPYNFVPLPAQVVLVPQEDIPDQDRYHTNGTDRIDRLSGRIECRLTTASPLYVRAGWQPEDFVAHGEKSFSDLKDVPGQQERRADFFHHGAPQRPRIPGSSLRGMLRALVEIVGYGKMERVTERQHFFFRAVAANKNTDDPLAIPYKTMLANVRAGYLTRLNDHWAIIPAQPFGREGYLKARQSDIPSSLGVMRFSAPSYQPQYIAVSFTTKTTKTGRMVIDQIDKPGIHQYGGMLITSGNMIETGSGSQFSPRKNHAVAGERQKDAQPIFIEDQAIEDYCTSLTVFQRGEGKQDSPFDHRLGVLAEGRPIFYCDPGRGKPVTLFGQSPNFRVPYRFPGASRAATPRDFVPEHLRHVADTDLADAIFGYVRPGVSVDKARAGRLFVSDAELEGEPQQLWCEPEVITPKILSGPKPTTFQHYLVQESTQKRNLMHYASTPTDETVVRGHKRYWHKPNVPLADMIERDLGKIAKAASQYTCIKPVAPGVSFCFTLRFENLSQIELGALLWVLRLAADERYRLALGMGKPLGMGAVSISSSVYKDDRQARYSRLLDGAQWQTGEQALEQAGLDACLTDFKDYVLKESGEQERGHTELDQPLRMRCLLALLSWKEAPPAEKAGYMELERFRERPVLPRPTQVIGWEPAPTTASASPSQPKRQPATPVAVPMVAPAAAPSEPVVELRKLDLNIVLTGNKKGELRTSFGRGVQVEVNLKGYALPKDTKEVVGFLSRQDAGGSTSGGFRGTLVDVKVDGAILYLILKPVSKG